MRRQRSKRGIMSWAPLARAWRLRFRGRKSLQRPPQTYCVSAKTAPSCRSREPKALSCTRGSALTYSAASSQGPRWRNHVVGRRVSLASAVAIQATVARHASGQIRQPSTISDVTRTGFFASFLAESLHTCRGACSGHASSEVFMASWEFATRPGLIVFA
ncbi:unnamed protein product [Effrenium voratum]|nr:unnamed protein product [Effrenium voratum]